ncbi:MAG: helix-turn-helix transcriptional regulator [Hespellia sp.]|nr:helix-turn-helix transcriptional regulator [Hespellia sp.]
MPNMQLSKNLVTLRKIHKLTQENLSDILHISRQAYSNYETMKRNPDLEALLILCSLYHVSIDEMVNQNIGNEIATSNHSRNIALDLSTATTLYLNSDETYLLLKYRDMDKEKRSSLRNFVDSL